MNGTFTQKITQSLAVAAISLLSLAYSTEASSATCLWYTCTGTSGSNTIYLNCNQCTGSTVTTTCNTANAGLPEVGDQYFWDGSQFVNMTNSFRQNSTGTPTSCSGTQSSTSCTSAFLVNPGFENGLWEWGTWGPVASITTAYSGIGAAQLTGSNSGVSQDFSGLAGTTYTATVWAQAQNTNWGFIQIEFFNSSWQLIGTSPQAHFGTVSSYTQFSTTATAPSGTAYFQVVIGASEYNSGYVRVDDVCVTASGSSSCAPCTNNLVTNGHFNVNTTGWNSWNGNFAKGTSWPQCSSAGNGEIQHTTGWAGFSQDIPGIAQGASMTLTFWAGVHDPAYDATFGVQFYNASGGSLGQLVENIDRVLGGTPSMQFYTINTTVPAGTATVKLVGSLNGGWLKVDEICLTSSTSSCNPDNPNAPPYCAPTPNCTNGTGTLLWSQSIDSNTGNPSTVRMYCGSTTSYTIPGPYPAAFNSAVTVNVTDAVGWDGYSSRGSVSQPNERFRIVFKKNGVTVASTPYSGDVPDNVIQGYWRGALGGSITLPNGADAIIIEHWSVANDCNSPNSLVPSSICISYANCNLSLSSHPSNQTICQGGTTSFTVAATGASSPTYQWQYYNGSSWVNVANGTPAGATYTGATAATLQVAGVSATGAYQYRAAVSASGCTTVNSNPATLTVTPDPTISITPSSSTVCVGGTVTLTATPGNGTGTCTIQWQSGTSSTGPWTNISGQTGTTYNAPTATAGTVYYRATYTCTGSGCDAAASNVATVVVTP
ncbi:MAG: hypothetical protein IAE84_08915, partial [Saprospiraceae bacterium]|nr:hypothetical protein [Saprospiraceae bacterium]